MRRHGKEVEDESSLQADLKRSEVSLDKVILVREWLKEIDGKQGWNEQKLDSRP